MPMSATNPTAHTRMGRPPKYGESALRKFTARLPEQVADIVKARQEAAGRKSLSEQVVADLAKLYGVELDGPYVQEEIPKAA